MDNALSVETQTWNTYDGLGRITKSQQIGGNGDGSKVLSTTLTEYAGDRTTVTPPKGATPVTRITDARGNTTDLLQYHATTPTGTYDRTHYTYTPAGKVAGFTDPSGNDWEFTYDQSGNQTLAHDPDKGDTTSVYDDRDQLLSTTDSHHRQITHVYDGLGRETETHDGDAGGPLLTKHVWDPAGYQGQLASATRYVGGATGSAYTTTYNIYDTLYRPNRTTTTIPSVTGEEKLAGSYQTNIKYNPDGTVQSAGYPPAGSLPSEAVTPTYDDVLRPLTLTGTGGTDYITGTIYNYTGKPLEYVTRAAARRRRSTTPTSGAPRLSNSTVNRDGVPGTDESTTYGYDEAGNITSASNISRDGTDNQCYQYDYLARLTEAWAQPTTTCATTPTGTALGGPAPYWQSYTYDTSGNRRTQTIHDTTGDVSKDVKSTYQYPAPGTSHPHALTQVEASGPNGLSVNSYTYDETGNTRTRTINGDTQTLDWNAEGNLDKVTEPTPSGTKTTSYVYGADGERLLRRTDSATTLYLGTTEITLAKGAAAAEATRYYDLGGGNQAIRTDDNKLSFLIGDHNGTSQLAIDAVDLTLLQRRSTPFGDPRGTQPTNWPGEKGFVGGTQDDTTGLVHLGAREYDPAEGRFISADPVLDLADPQQVNGYSYSDNSPVTRSDPTGLESCYPNDSCSQSTIETINKNSNPNPKPSKSKGGSNGNGSATSGAGNVGTAPDGQPTINGIRIPKKEELSYFTALDEDQDTYGHRLSVWVKDKCSEREGKAKAFCDTANRAGLLETGDDPFGVKVNISCVTGHGRCTEAIIIDLLTVASWGLGRVAASAGFLSLAEKAGPAGTKVLRSLGLICSFSPDTRVLMKDGRTKPIVQVKPGDKVEAANPKTGKHQGPHTVTARLVHHDDDLVDLKIRVKDGRTDTLHTTSLHPFWDDTEHAWIQAGNLTPGHALNTTNGKHARLLDVDAQPGAANMYNLTVAQLHTYYVLAGNTPVLVHNAGSDPVTPKIIQRGLQQIQDGTLSQRRNPDGTLDHFRNLENNKRNAWWVGAKIYAPDPSNNDYRILEKDGQFKWVGPKGNMKGAGHFYGKLMDVPGCA